MRSMLLFDAGNSRCKWTWAENGTWLRQGVFDNTDEFAWQKLHDLFATLAAPQKILVSNVAGAAMEQRLRQLCAIWPCALQFIVAQAEQCGVRNGYAHAAQLGSDRWAALIAAWQRVHGACLVVNCGTATTVDALSAGGEFLGGLIVPGMTLMQRSLLQNTAQLGLQDGEFCDFPRTTADAITSGVMQASIGAIRQQYALLAAKGEVRCILSGGAAGSLLPHLGLAAEQVDNLVLQGLQIIGQNCSTNTETVA